MKRIGVLLSVCSIPLFLFSGCASTANAPPELVNARASYQRAASGPAAQVDPTDLHEAQLALNRAEDAFRDDPTAPQTTDLAAIAGLKADNADARAQLALAEAAKVQTAKAKTDLMQSQLQGAQGQAAAAQGQAVAARTDAAMTRQQLDAERAKRADLEKQLNDARATLARIAAIKDTDRGMVITFQGEVLFKTGESQLKAEAMLKLDKVAEVLRGQERKIVVEGHTDNQGGAGAYNQNLSEKRASAVRDYLVGKGIPADMIRSVGYGPTKPVGENTSPEGRAANRRVEIIVEPRSPQQQ